MSMAERIPWERGMEAAKALIAELEIPDALIAGSLRRRVPMVGDIELVVPLPGSFFQGIEMPMQPPDGDPLLDRLNERFTAAVVSAEPSARKCAPPGLFVAAAETGKVAVLERCLGRAIKGVKPGFRYCQLEMPLRFEPRALVKVDIFRFVPGPMGNRGWIELIRTGPAELGQKACARWKYISRGGYSEDGFPHRADGTRLPVPTEMDAFELLGWDYIEPEYRR